MLLYFSLTLFVSALLLFLVQPMVGKMILPLLGGTPAVWNTCMVFFQAALLAGYAYTHTLSTSLSRRGQLLVQGALLFFPFLVLPFAIGTWQPPTETNPIFAVLWLLLAMVGLPFFVVSTSAPLLQKWFGHTGHPAARDPYFLYGASNLGSMLALLAYPILVEPNFGVDEQVRLWTYTYAGFVVLVLGCALLIWRSRSIATAAPALHNELALSAVVASADGGAAIVTPGRRLARHLPSPAASAAASLAPGEVAADRLTLGRRLRWIGLAAAPSSLMLGVTTYMTTDIAAVPFFWVTPLALYLLTFILVFARWPVVWTKAPHSVMLYLQPCFVLLLALKMLANLTPRVFTILGVTIAPTAVDFFLHLGAFFTTALVCHGELARDRPSARHLTEFYLWLSVGGVLGGLFNALIAPLAFQYGIFEYPVAMVFAYLMRPDLVGDIPLIPGDSTSSRRTRLGYAFDLAVPVLLGLATWGVIRVVELKNPYLLTRSIVLAVAVVAVFMLISRPLRFGLALGALFLTVTLYDRYYEPPAVYEGRSFFGLLRVRAQLEEHWLGLREPTTLVGLGGNPWAQLVALHAPDQQAEHLKPVEFKELRTYHTLMHGGINHGREIITPAHRRSQPITYFHPTNGIGEIFDKFSWSNARLPASLAGLGNEPLTALVGLHSEPPYGVIGLGTGTLAAHARPLQTVHFYEIDTLVRQLSLPPPGKPHSFYYVQEALDRGADLHIIMGDGRRQIEKAPAQYYHVLLIDAFSSDAIPVHLLTKEAIELYMAKLADGGVLIFNTTNRFVDLPGPLAAIARELDLDCLQCGDYSGGDALPDKYGADWVVLQRKARGHDFANGGLPLRVRLDLLDPPLETPLPQAERDRRKRWDDIEPLPGPVWTDNYTNLFRVLRWR